MRATDRPGLGMPLAVCLVVAAGLLGGWFAAGGEKEDGASAAPARRVAPVPVIARRVEAIRRLKFTAVPRPAVVGRGQARREGLADLDRTYPEAERHADEELYKLLGLLGPGDDLREISASIYEGQIAGYYDPRSGALRVVDTGGVEDPVADETTLAHELVHALEDQRFDLDLEDLALSGDAALAYVALVEGTATALMQEYQRRHFKPSEALGSALAAGLAVPSTEGIPPFITAQMVFPYLGGARFVSELYDTGGESWRLVDVALRARRPASTEQVMHPRAWLRAEQPSRVRVGDVRRALGSGWKRVAAQTFGEWQTRELLARGGAGDAAPAAAGWGGDRYELWRRGPLAAPDCAAPCVERDVLVLRWRWDTRRDAVEFRDALAKVDSAAEGGGLEVAARGRDAWLVLAPTKALAAKVWKFSHRRGAIR